MTEPRDNLDDWLQTEIHPMQPPPGTFGQIRKRARRRKTRQALVSAASAGAAAAVIVLAVVALPRVVPNVLHLHTAPAGHSQAAPLASGVHTASKAASPFANSTPPAALPEVPPDFDPTSVTFASLDTGWVIGQAAVGMAGYCRSGYCTSMARTDNAGKSWYGLPAPLTGAPDGSTGVGQVRFLDPVDGWAFGPQLWATHNGGSTWAQVTLPAGMRVTSLETVGSEAFAVFAKCAGTGADFASDCTQFTLYSSPAASNDWMPVPGASGSSPGQAASSATVVLTPGQGYLYMPDGTLLSGSTTGGASWQAVSPTALPCLPGAAQADGQPSGGQFAASAASDLALACPASRSVGGQFSTGLPETVYTSVNGGQSWQQQGSPTIQGIATSLAAGIGGVMTLATTDGIEVSSDGGAAWQQTQAGPSGGFGYVGLTSQLQGIAVPADASLHEVLFTHDSGQSWLASPIANG